LYRFLQFSITLTAPNGLLKTFLSKAVSRSVIALFNVQHSASRQQHYVPRSNADFVTTKHFDVQQDGISSAFFSPLRSHTKQRSFPQTAVTHTS
jgi:hypothetical protein